MVTATLRKRTQKAPAVVEVEAQVVGQDVPGKPPETDLANLTLDAEGPADLNESAPTTQALTPRQGTSHLTTRQTFSGEGIEGDWGEEDLKFPRLALVQGNGKLSKEYNQGTVIYNGELLMEPPVMKDKRCETVPLRFVPVSLKKQYREKLSQDEQADGGTPRIFDTLADVQEAGLTTIWPRGAKTPPENYAEESGSMILLVEAPAGSDHPSFVLPFGDKNYAVAVYYAGGAQFRASIKAIFNTALTSLMVPILDELGQPKKNIRGQVMKKPMLWKNFWTIVWSKEESNGHVVWRPTVKILTKEVTSDEIRGYAENLLHTEIETPGAPTPAA